MATTAAAIVNRALELIGSQVQVTGNNPTFDGTVAGNAAGVLYTPAVELVMRETNPAFARRTATLSVAPGGLIAPWTRKYTYPADCVRVRSLRPSVYNANDPRPIRAAVVFDADAALKVIVTNEVNASVVYTSNAAIESQFDSSFCEAVARKLANPLAMAVGGRPDFARELLGEAQQYESMAELIDEP